MSNCKFCDYNRVPKTWEIGLYRATSYKYEGRKYFLEVEYPLGDLTIYPRINPIEVNFCPMCGRKLQSEEGA